MKKPLALTLFALTLLAFPFHADAGEEGHSQGEAQDQKEGEAPEPDSVWGALKYTGHHIKKGSVYTGHKIKDGSVYTGHKIKDGSVYTGKQIKKGSVYTGKQIEKGSVKTGKSIKKFFTGD